jgi:hypothetical protein
MPLPDVLTQEARLADVYGRNKSVQQGRQKAKAVVQGCAMGCQLRALPPPSGLLRSNLQHPHQKSLGTNECTEMPTRGKQGLQEKGSGNSSDHLGLSSFWSRSLVQ